MDNTLQAIALGGLALLSLVAVILLLIQRTQLRRALENARRDQQLLGDQLLDALDAQRMESSETLRALNDSLLNTLSAVTQHQTALLESSQRQALMTSRNLEERFGQMSDATARSPLYRRGRLPHGPPGHDNPDPVRRLRTGPRTGRAGIPRETPFRGHRHRHVTGAHLPRCPHRARRGACTPAQCQSARITAGFLLPKGERAMSYADQVFIQTCQDILSKGVWDTDRPVRPRWEDGTPAHTIRLFGVVNRYDLRKEFPIITVRKQFLKSAVDELLWIWQKKSNDVHQLSSHIWDAWADENGTIGKAYGYQLGVKHHYPQGDMDQVDKVLWDLKHDPGSRRILTNLYNHHDLSEMALYPCAYSMTFNVSGNTLNGILNQRSQDMLTANGWNVMQYAVLLHMFAQVSGLEAGELVHVIADAHIYDRHVPIVEEIIALQPYDAPKFIMDKSVTDFYAFTKDSFRLEGYQAHPLEEKIPVAV